MRLNRCPGTQAAGVAGQFDLFVLGLQGFDAGAGVVFAVLALHVGARVVVQGIVAGSVWAGHGRAYVDACAGALEVVVVELQRAGLDFLGQVPVVYVVTLALLLVLGVVGHRAVAGRRGVGSISVGQHQHMSTLLMAEEVVDPFLLHQAADEVETGLAILHAVFPLAIRPAQGVFEIGKAQVAEHLLDDLRDGEVLENPAIGGTSQQPKPRAQGGLVTGELALVDVLAETGHDAMEITLATAIELQAHAHGLAEHLIEVDGVIQRVQLQLIVEQPPQFFAAAHVLEQQYLRSQGAGDLGQA